MEEAVILALQEESPPIRVWGVREPVSLAGRGEGEGEEERLASKTTDCFSY